MFRIKAEYTKIGVMFTFSLCVVTSAYVLYLQKYDNLNIQASGQQAIEDFSLYEMLPKDSPFGRGKSWPFTPVEEIPPHPKFASRSQDGLQPTSINKLLSGQYSFAQAFLPPSWRKIVENTKETKSE